MDQNDLQSEVSWRGKVPVSTRFDDPYFSLKDGLAESRYTFLDGNGLPERFEDGFHVAELGFGTGLNALATLDAWETTGSFRFTSFEAFPMDALGPMEVEVIVGDVQDTLPEWDGMADAWYLDGFAPSRNAEMWSQAVLSEVARHTNGRFSSDTAFGVWA